MLLGYNTNGFAHHRLDDALAILADLGYQSVAVTLDYHCLDPFDPGLPAETARVRSLLDRLKLRSVVETGARFLLDPRRKHRPTLLSPTREERRRRLDFLKAAVRVAALLGSDAVSFWSGTPDSAEAEGVLFARLVDGCRCLCEEAAASGVRLAFEPEPGMFVDSVARFDQLFRAVDHPSFGLTLDIGHLQCLGELPITDHIRRWRGVLWNVHIEDMRRGVHDHLMFGDGEIDFPPVIRELADCGYAGGLHVELSRHSHDAVRTAEAAAAFLGGLVRDVSGQL